MSKIILVPLYHDIQEETINKSISDVLKNYKKLNFKVYWESKIRTKRVNDYNLGLEDPVMLALFELCVFVISYRDIRLYEKMYQGMGRISPDDEKYRKLSIPEESIHVAKGSESVLNLRLSESYKHLVDDIDLDQLILNRYNLDYVERYARQLIDVFYKLIKMMANDETYDGAVDFNHVTNMIELINPEEVIPLNIKYAQWIKDYVTSCRDMSNINFISSDTFGDETVIICCGISHIPNLKYYIYNLDIPSYVIKTPYEINIEDIGPDEYMKKISKEFETIFYF